MFRGESASAGGHREIRIKAESPPSIFSEFQTGGILLGTGLRNNDIVVTELPMDGRSSRTTPPWIFDRRPPESVWILVGHHWQLLQIEVSAS